MVEELEDAGARPAFYTVVEAVGNLEGCSAILIPREKNAVILALWNRVAITRRGKETLGCVVTSSLSEGTYLSTTNLPARMNTPPEYKVLRHRNAAPAEL